MGCQNDIGAYLNRKAKREAKEARQAKAAPREWSGSPCDRAPDNCWIDDETGEHVNATTCERTPAHP